MKQSKFTEKQIVEILEEGQRTGEELCREHGIHKQTYYGWAEEVRRHERR